MKHLCFRIIIGMIWIVASITCVIKGNIQMAVLFVILALVYMYSAFGIIKKMKKNK